MVEVIGIVEQGQIKLPPTIHLSEGQSVRVLLDGLASTNSLKPEDYPREGEDWTEEDLQIDLDWAMRQRRNT